MHIGIRLLYSLGLATLVTAGMNANAQTLLANFSDSSFNATNDTLTDSVHGLVAYGANSGNTVGANGGIVTTYGGFTFNADSLTSLVGSTTYTLAVSFSYSGGAPGHDQAYEGSGVLGGDLPGGGDGDANLAVTADGGGQIVGSLGATNGNDYSVYDTSGGTPNFDENQTVGAVLVVNGSTETLYVNGVATAQGSPLTLPAGVDFTPFGDLYNGGSPTATTSYAFGIGTNTNGTSANDPLNGEIYAAQVYSGALSASQAEALSANLETAPEPSTWAMLAGGVVTLLAIGRFRRRSSVA